MDASKFKTTKTSRGLTYNYYYAPSQGHKPTLLLCHGFPSNSRHWEKIASFFETEGYGVLAPDMLGYGGTSKPLDATEYVPSKVTRDLVDIMDTENVHQAIAVGHDW